MAVLLTSKQQDKTVHVALRLPLEFWTQRRRSLLGDLKR
jgi:hypothetical protein